MPSEDSGQPTHSRSLIRILTGRILDSQGGKVSSCRERRKFLDCADARLNVRWLHMSDGMFTYVVAQRVSLKTATHRWRGARMMLHSF